MRYKRKLKMLLIIGCVLLGFMMTGCGSHAEGGTAGQDTNISGQAVLEGAGEISIVTTIFPPYDFAKQIAGDRAEVVQLLPAGAESHTFEPTPQDIIKIQNCDVFIYAGGESDTWIEEILSSINTDEIQLISMMDCVEAVEEETVEGMQEEHENEEASASEEPDVHEETEYDEHVWTSPKNAVLITEKIAEVLQTIDAANAEEYQSNAEAFVKELETLDAEFAQVVAEGSRNTIVVGDRFPFRYLADAYGLEYFAAFPGCSEDAEPSAATLAFLIHKVEDEKIPVVFHIEFSNEKIADSICETTGAETLLLHSCHNISKDEMEAGVTYLELMEQNLSNLKEALQ